MVIGLLRDILISELFWKMFIENTSFLQLMNMFHQLSFSFLFLMTHEFKEVYKMSLFQEDWVEAARKKIKMARPDLRDEQIEAYLAKVMVEKLKNPPCTLDNNYVNISYDTNLINLYEWLTIQQPIIGGYGVLFKDQYKSVNNIARMIRKFLESRTMIKNRMKKNLELYGPDSYEYKQDDRLQGAEKVNANACYGAGGSSVSFSYNLYAAAATTATAQSLISTACAAFESFMTNNTKFYDLDEILTFIKNVCEEKHKLGFDGITFRTKEEVYNKILSGCFDPDKINKSRLNDILDNLTKEELTRVFYKNNLFVFTKSCGRVLYLLRKIMRYTKSFRAPEKKFMTEELENDLKTIWKYYKEFVHYNHPIYNRIFRLKTSERRSVLVIDTDSNMILIRDWINMILEAFVDLDNECSKEEIVYTSASLIGVFISYMIQDTLDLYCKNANVPKEFWKNINMKNEFFFETLITSSVKKNYMGKILLREGRPMKGKLDIKGLSFVKSGISEHIGEYMKDIIQSDIMGEEINFRNIIHKLNDLANSIRDSLLAGNPKYAKPMAVKDFDMYKNPLSEMGIKAVMAHNYVYPEDPIQLPDHIRAIKVSLSKRKDVEPLKETNPDIYKKIIDNLFENEKLRSGITAFAIPQTQEKIPEWLIPFIDIDTIVEDNMKSFFPVLKSLGFEILNTRATNTTFSNIIQM